MSSHVVPVKSYLWVFAGLILLTIATTEIAKIDLGEFNAVVAMLIAAGKTSLVVLFFMHMKWSGYRSQVVAFMGLVWLAIMMALTFSDYATRTWTPAPGAWEPIGRQLHPTSGPESHQMPKE